MRRLPAFSALTVCLACLTGCWIWNTPPQGEIVLVPESPGQPLTAIGGADAPTEGVAGTTGAPPAPQTPVPTPFPTIAPEAAATAVSFYFQSAGQPGGNPNFRLIIPALGINSGITTLGWATTTVDGSPVTTWDDPKDAVGFLVNSALPGANGNTVMIGHNNVYTAIFANLADLKKGDAILVTLNGTQTTYRVTETTIRRETGATAAYRQATLAYFNPTRDARLTLLTCWPERSNTHRVVVVAKP